MTKATTLRNVSFVLLGVIGLVLKSHYTGPFTDVVHSYLGNVAVSFAIYFLFLQQAGQWRVGKLPAAAAALVVVEAFEAFNGFGIMTNVYDTIDFLANAAGIGLAFALDITLDRFLTRRKARPATSHDGPSAA